MNAKCLFFSQPFLSVFLIHFAWFSTIIHTSEALNSTTGDRLALLAIKSMIKDDPQGVMTSWNRTTTNFCQWEGVTCSPRHQRVNILDLSSSGLVGTLSPSVGNLSFLRAIRLFNNSFSGKIPYEIGRLFRLEELRIHNNSFTGSIPGSISNCSNLQVLHLGFNKLVGKIPDGIGSLSMLTFLILHTYNPQGGIPSFIANLTLLDTLSLSDCQLGGRFPDVFQRLTNLRRVALAGNNLTGTIPPSFYNCSSLEMVLLDENQLTGRLPFNLSLILPHLSTLSLPHNHIQGKFLDIPPTLQVLDLSSNNFVGKLPSLSNGSSHLDILLLSNNFFVGSLHNLVCTNGVNMNEVLDLGNNHLSGEIPECWEKWPGLYYLSLETNNLSGEIPRTLTSVNGTKGIKALNLGNNQLSGVIPECGEKWKSLEILNLENNNFSGKIPRTLGCMPSLQILNMRGNKISGRLPSSLRNLSYLKILQLGRNNLGGNIPAWIGIKFTMLKILNLRSNNFYGNIPHELCYLSHVQILDLAHNNLFGNIPRCFNNFSVLSGMNNKSEVQISIFYRGYSYIAGDSLVIKGREDVYRTFLGLVTLLDLSSNNFSGEIPIEFTALHELTSLNLSRNQFIGKIPDKIGEMKALESLDLSVNKLTGELPISLSKLNFLCSLNVSYNNLIGRIPRSTQIQSLNESNFYGNKLCGAPLTDDCVPVDVTETVGDPKENDGLYGRDWGLIISIVLGFIIGFWVIVVSLILNRSWRMVYFTLLSKLIKVRSRNRAVNPLTMTEATTKGSIEGRSIALSAKTTYSSV